MEIVEPGHVYRLDYLDLHLGMHPGIDTESKLVFVNREKGHEHPGTQSQEVLRALIDRTYHCDSCLPNELNSMIIHHMRMAIIYHEMRAIERKGEQGLIVEALVLGRDGHFDFRKDDAKLPNAAPRRIFTLKPPVAKPNHPEY